MTSAAVDSHHAVTLLQCFLITQAHRNGLCLADMMGSNNTIPHLHIKKTSMCVTLR